MKNTFLIIVAQLLLICGSYAQNFAFDFTKNRGSAVEITNGMEIKPPWTAEMWVYKVGTTAHASVISGPTYKINLETWGASQKVGLTHKGAWDVTFPKGYVVPVGQWVHLAFSTTGSKTYLYVNGTLTDSVSNVINLPMQQIGNSLLTESPNGYIDEVRFWKEARSSQQLSDNMRKEIDPTSTNLVSYWRANDQASPATNSTAGQHTGMLRNNVGYIAANIPDFSLEDTPFEIKSLTTITPTQYLLSPGSADQQIAKITISSVGVFESKSIRAITVSLEGTTDLADIANLKIYASRNNNTLESSQLFASVASPTSRLIEFNGNQELASGPNYFWVVADIAASASLTNKINGLGVSVGLSSNEELPIEALQPQGSRTILAPQEITTPETISIIPIPKSMEIGEGRFELNSSTKIIAANDTAKIEADFLANLLRPSTGFPLPNSTGTVSDNSIYLSIIEDNSLGFEGYRLTVSSTSIKIEATTRIGLFWGIQSLRQLLPPKIESKHTLEGQSWTVPVVSIIDAPRYKHRGSMLDVCRHIFSVDMIKKYIDMLALYKMNVFHWHLSEDQGFRVESKRYPELNTISSWRSCPGNTAMVSGESVPYGGFYTHEEIREVVAYATERHIEVIPEIEMPGHSVAILAARPELGCTSGTRPYVVRCAVGVSTDMYCAGKDSVFTFIENLLDEIIPLFPSKRFHIGADETPFNKWSTCTDCQKRLTEIGLTGGPTEHNMKLLKKYFTDRIVTFLKSRGKETIGWTEIADGGFTPGLIVQDWLGGAAERAARNGNEAIRSLYYHIYLDAAQSSSNEPYAIGYAPNTLEKFYNFTIMPSGLTEEEQRFIIGAEAPMWTEYIVEESHLEYMLSPRIQALAENTWSQDEHKDLNDFKNRLYVHYERWDTLNYNSRRLDVPGTLSVMPELASPKTITICANETISAPVTASAYYWTDATNSTSQHITIEESGVYTVYMNYLGKMLNASYNVTVKPELSKPSVELEETDEIKKYNITGNADEYVWYNSGSGPEMIHSGDSFETEKTYSEELWIAGRQALPQTYLKLSGGSYVSMPATHINTNTVTMEAWIKREGTQNDVAGILFSRASSAYGLSIRSNNQLMLHWNDNYWSWNSGLVVPDNEWVHVALVITPIRATIYMNNQMASNTGTYNVEAFDTPLQAGFDNGNRHFKGAIDEVRLWKRALSKNEIDLNKYKQLSGNEKDLVAYYKFNEGTGSMTVDEISQRKATIMNLAASSWDNSSPCPIENYGCESERWNIAELLTSVPTLKNSTIQIYPNPTNSILFITGEIQTIKNIRIYNELGQLCYSKKPNLKNNTIEVDVSRLNKGVFFMELDKETNEKTTKSFAIIR